MPPAYRAAQTGLASPVEPPVEPPSSRPGTTTLPRPVAEGAVDVRPWSAGLAVLRVLAAPRAELVHREAVGVVATVLLRDVVAFLAFHTRHRDLRTDVAALAGHGNLLFRELMLYRSSCDGCRAARHAFRGIPG